MKTKKQKSEDSHEIKLTKRERSTVVLKSTLKIGATKVKNKLTKGITSTNASNLIQEQNEIAEIIFKGLCQLRGTAIKIAQAISGGTNLLSSEQMAILQQSHYQVPGLNPVVVAKMIRSELKQDPEELFSEFDYQAFAAASLGQVHRARLREGLIVAVKVQYPGIDQTISIDIGLMRKFLSYLPRNGVVLNSLSEIESRLNEEVNYQSELAYAVEFAQLFAHTKIVIPKVYSQYSSRRVITYELLQGQHPQEWLKGHPDKNRRSLVGQQIWDLFLTSLFKHRLLHCDPNWGNYLITSGDCLALLDFGCVQKLPIDAIELFCCLWDRPSEANKAKLIAVYRKLGAEPEKLGNQGENIFYERVIAPYQSWLLEIIQQPLFDFEASKGRSHHGAKLLLTEIFSVSMQNFSAEFTMIHRTFFGMLQLLEALGAQIDPRRDSDHFSENSPQLPHDS